MSRTTSTRLLTLTAALAAAACGAGGTQPIEETRTLAEPRSGQAAALDTKSRMGLTGAPEGFVHPPMGGHGAEAPTAAGFAWDLPKGWTELPPTQLRQGNFAVPGHEKLECYVTVLPGGAGGLAGNLNRWRKQMGLADMGDTELAALPRVKLLGEDAALLVVDGTYKGAGAESGTDGYTLAAAALERPGSMVFVKMIGPAADVAAELASFKSLCASLRETKSGAPAPAAGNEPTPLRWTAPQDWKQGPAKQMRLVTFSPKEDPRVECYVTILAGSGGGLAANVNRWRQQLSLTPLAPEAIAALPTVEVLGRASPVVEIDGGKVGLLGLVCELGTQSVFVKMTGPMDALRAEREHFVSFCTSLAQE